MVWRTPRNLRVRSCRSWATPNHPLHCKGHLMTGGARIMHDWNTGSALAGIVCLRIYILPFYFTARISLSLNCEAFNEKESTNFLWQQGLLLFINQLTLLKRIFELPQVRERWILAIEWQHPKDNACPPVTWISRVPQHLLVHKTHTPCFVDIVVLSTVGTCPLLSGRMPAQLQSLEG